MTSTLLNMIVVPAVLAIWAIGGAWMRPDEPIDWPRGAICGFASAALFGLSAPLSKRLLPDIGPMLLAGLLYLGAGLGLTVVSLIRGRPWHSSSGPTGGGSP